jgi:hypothetical protein
MLGLKRELNDIKQTIPTLHEKIEEKEKEISQLFLLPFYLLLI